MMYDYFFSATMIILISLYFFGFHDKYSSFQRKLHQPDVERSSLRSSTLRICVTVCFISTITVSFWLTTGLMFLLYFWKRSLNNCLSCLLAMVLMITIDVTMIVILNSHRMFMLCYLFNSFQCIVTISSN